MEFAPLIIVAIALLFTVMALQRRTKQNKEIATLNKDAVTFEDKMLILQKESNRSLKGIDNTLDWFFWLMILSIILSSLYAFFSSMNQVY